MKMGCLLLKMVTREKVAVRNNNNNSSISLASVKSYNCCKEIQF